MKNTRNSRRRSAPKTATEARAALAQFTAAALRGSPPDFAESQSVIDSTSAPIAPGSDSEGV